MAANNDTLNRLDSPAGSGTGGTNDGTFAKETGGNLDAIKADVDKIPSQGQALAAASTPVVLPVAQITALTPPAALTNYANETGGNLATIAGKDFATQTTLALVKAKTDNLDVALSTRTKPSDQQHVIVDSGVTTGLTDTQLRATAVPVSLATAPTTPVTGTFFQATQPVSGTFFQTTQPVSLSTVPQATLPSAEVNGQTTGTTAGTAVQLPSNSLAVGAIVQALSTNTTSIFVGISTVSSSNGFELQPGQSTSVGVNNTSAVWIVSTTNGDKVCWIGS